MAPPLRQSPPPSIPPPPPCCLLVLSRVWDWISKNLDLLSSTSPSSQCTTPLHPPAFQLLDATGRVSFCLPCAEVWFSRDGAWISHAVICFVKRWRCCFFRLFCYFFVFIILCCSSLSGFVLLPLYFAVPDLSSNSASTTSTSFGWLSLFLSKSIDRLVLLYTHLASVTALCGPLRELGH